MSREVRNAIGVALFSALAVIVLAGFVVESARETLLIYGGFAAGLVTVCVLDKLNRRTLPARREQPKGVPGRMQIES
ncbi:MAG: hypothetical protein ACYC5M_02325 [Anaerolineae bacterium]